MLLLRLLGMSVRSGLQYRKSFLFGLVAFTFVYFCDFICVWIIMTRLPSLAGFSILHVMVMYGLAMISYSIYRTFGDELNNFQDYLLSGSFDQVLTKPMHPLIYLIGARADFSNIGGLFGGAWFVWYGFYKLGIRLGALKSLFLAGEIAAGIVILFSIGIIAAAIAFWTVRNYEITVLMIYATNTAGSYPVTIYNRAIADFLTFVLPVSFVNFYPTLWLFGMERILSGRTWLVFSGGIAAAWMLILALFVWGRGVRKYSGAGA